MENGKIYSEVSKPAEEQKEIKITIDKNKKDNKKKDE